MTTHGILTLRLLLSSVMIPGIANAVEANNWAAKGRDNSSDRLAACTLVTPHKNMDDTQGRTEIWLEINHEALTVKTGSEIDAEFKDIAIKVDENALIPFDVLDGKTNAVFNKAVGTITQQFITGQNVRVQLRFWPTWPSQGLKTSDFSLIGFTKAYNALQGCGVRQPEATSGETSEQDHKEGGQPKEGQDEIGNKI